MIMMKKYAGWSTTTVFTLMVTQIIIGCLTCPVSAVDILYDFEDQTSRLNIVDVLTADGSQNGQVNQPSGWGLGDGPTYGPTDGVGGSGGLDFVDIQRPFPASNMVETQGVIDFTTSMSFSVDIKPTILPATGTTTTLLWTGSQRGTGETGFAIDEFGRITFYMLGLSGGSQVSTGSNLIQLDQYQSVGFTLGVEPGDDLYVDGRTLKFYINGVVIDTFTGLGIGQWTLPNLAHATGSPVQVGWAQNIGVGSQTQYTGYMDNVFISSFLAESLLCVNPPFYLDADLNQDCYVNFTDLSLFVNQWLWCTDTGEPYCDQYQPAPEYLDSDLEPDYYVEGKDFAKFANQWQWCSNPVDPNCDQYIPPPPPPLNVLGGWFTSYRNLTFNDEIVWPLGISGRGTYLGAPYYTPDSGLLSKYSAIVVGEGYGGTISSTEKSGMEQWVFNGGTLIITAAEGPSMWLTPPSWLGFTSWWAGLGTYFRIANPSDPLAAGITSAEAATLYSAKGVTGLLPGSVSVMSDGGSVSFVMYKAHGSGYIVYLGDFLVPRKNPSVVQGQIIYDMRPAAIEVWRNLVSHLNLPTQSGEVAKWWDLQPAPKPALTLWWRYETSNPLGGALYSPTYPQPGEELTSLEFDMGKGERNWKYFFLTTSTALSTLEVRPTDLNGPGGSVIPISDISISIQEKPWPEYTKASYCLVDPCHVEPLYSPDVSLEANRTYTYWLKVRCPEDIPAGTYQGDLEFINGGSVQETLPVIVEVWPLYQPGPDVLHYELEHDWWGMPGGAYIYSDPKYNDPDLLADYMYHLRELGVDFGQNFGEIAMSYADNHLPPYTRIKESGIRLSDWISANPNAFDDPYDASLLPHIDYSCYDAMYFDNAVAAGFTNFAMSYGKPSMTTVYERQMKWRYTEYATYLKEKGFPQVYTKIMDEFGPSDVAAFIDAASFIQPTGFKTYTTTASFQYDPASVLAIDPYLDMWQCWAIVEWDQIKSDLGITWDPANERWAYTASSYWGNYIDYARAAGWAIAYGKFEGLHTHGYTRWIWNDHAGTLPAFGLDYSANDTITVITNSQSVYQARYLAALYRMIAYANQKGLAASTVAYIESEIPNIIGPSPTATIHINYTRSYVAQWYGPNANDIFPEYLVSPDVFETAKVQIFELIQLLQDAMVAGAQPSLKYGDCSLVADGTQRFQIVRDPGYSAQADILSAEILRLTGITPVVSTTYNPAYPVHIFLGTLGATTYVQNIVAADVPDHITTYYPAADAYAIKYIPASSYTGGEVIMIVGGDGDGLEKGVNSFNNFLVPDENRP